MKTHASLSRGLLGAGFVLLYSLSGWSLSSSLLQQHARQLRARLPQQFTVVIEAPFVLAGDETPARVRLRAKNTVGWAVRLLKWDYFPRDPDHVITIYLFKNRSSYRKHALRFFGDTPDTPYGYYTARHKALVMNIATGGGTLVHEIVHPFMRANFAACPDWFNEGLASLYEQCGERNGKIWGFTNWRLAGLQRWIRSGRLRSFQSLCATRNSSFYTADPGSNYGQARYLCYYLQRKKLLRRFYHAFRKNQATDPTGYRTLQRLLGEKDMTAFQKRWEQWVLGLRFP